MAKSGELNYMVISAFNDQETNTVIKPGELYPADQKRAERLRAAGVIAEDDEGQALSKSSKSTEPKSSSQDQALGGASNADDT